MSKVFFSLRQLRFTYCLLLLVLSYSIYCGGGATVAASEITTGQNKDTPDHHQYQKTGSSHRDNYQHGAQHGAHHGDHHGKRRQEMKTCHNKNERYTTCASSTCFEESCADVLFAKPTIKKCTRDCRQGCQCKPGFFRNYDGRCVDELSCIVCGYGEDWIKVSYNDTDYDMPNFSNEEFTCDDTLYNDDIGGIISYSNNGTYFNKDDEGRDIGGRNAPNVAGKCVCAENFYRSRGGLCIKEEACVQCGPNEVYEHCGSSSCWEYNCKHSLIPIRDRLIRWQKKPCTLDCISGCKCHPGFYREKRVGENFGKCVSADMCLFS